MGWHRIAGETEIREGIYYEFDDSAKIGEGGMGTVYLGRMVDNYGNESKIAIKKISAGIDSNSTEMARARRESSIRIKHENLLYMYGMVTMIQTDFLGSVIEDNYVVMEYLDGIELVDFIDGHLNSKNNLVSENIKVLYARYLKDRFSVSAEIIRSVLSALSALHDAGYIHRDIDPRNVFITTDGVVKLIDFGLCKPLSNVSDAFSLSQANIHKQLSTNGQLMGKPSYSPPEVLLGQLAKQDRATDIYSVGMIYYQLITGKCPFEEEGDLNEIIEAQKKKNLPLASIPDKKVKAIIAKATTKDNRRRFRTCAEFRVALDRGKLTMNTRFIAIALTVVAMLSMSALVVKNIDLLADVFRRIFPPPVEKYEPSLTALCDSLVYQLIRGEKVDTAIVNSVRDSVSSKEAYAEIAWNKLTDSTLFLEQGLLFLHCESTFRFEEDLRIYDFKSQDKISGLYKDFKIDIKGFLKNKPFLPSALDTLFIPKNEYLTILLSDVFLDDMVEAPKRYGEDRVLFLFFSCFDKIEAHLGKDEQANSWFNRFDHILAESESNQWNRATKIYRSERYKKIKNKIIEDK